MINIKVAAKKWLLQHGHIERDPHFEEDIKSLSDMIFEIINHEGYVGDGLEYDSAFGDNEICKCSHTYYRHFDSYDNMAPIGCKYCPCSAFEEK